MKPRTACCCLLGVLCCWTQGYPETIYRHTDKNGVRCFTNSLIGENFHNRGLSDNPKPASAELQRAREQAEIEYWRAVEAKARSLRNTPDTEVHRKGRSSLQGENLSWPKAPSGKKFRGREREKMDSPFSPDRKAGLESAGSKKARYGKARFQDRKNTPEPESQRKKRHYSPRRNVALK